MVGQSRGLAGRAQVGMVGGHEHDLAVELAALPTPQELVQAVVLTGDEHRDAGQPAHVMQPPGHLERARHRLLEAAGNRRLRARGGHERHPQEERPVRGVRGVLVRALDVRAGVRQEARDRRDDADPVATGDDQAHPHRRGVHLELRATAPRCSRMLTIAPAYALRGCLNAPRAPLVVAADRRGGAVLPSHGAGTGAASGRGTGGRAMALPMPSASSPRSVRRSPSAHAEH